ncbi:MAG: AAA family ATPase [Planctomycetes bacterium]|nr:AAA family ATPase [Planctomycetota bacterium]
MDTNVVAPFAPVPCRAITPTAVSWLWEPYLARGKLAVLDGDPGTGKSFVTLDLAARVSSGAVLPGGGPAGEPGGVLLLNAEDDARDTIRPRLTAAGGDPDRVRVFFAPGIEREMWPTFPDDVAHLEAAVRATDAKLVVIDPLMAFLSPSAVANADQGARLALSPLAQLAARTGAAVVLVRHLRKSGGANAIYRGSGSVGIVGAARTGLMIARHPDDPDLRVLTQSKTNIGPVGPSLGFRLARGAGGESVVEWAGPVDVSADELFGSSVAQSAGARARGRAGDWLKQFLAGGARRAAEVADAARAAGIPARTLDRAKALAGARSQQRATPNGSEWWWFDPAVERARQREAMKEIDEAAALLFRCKPPS